MNRKSLYGLAAIIIAVFSVLPVKSQIAPRLAVVPFATPQPLPTPTRTSGAHPGPMRAVPKIAPDPCTLDSSKAPHVRGFFLGQIFSEVPLPNFSDHYISQAIKSDPDTSDFVLVSMYDVFP